MPNVTAAQRKLLEQYAFCAKMNVYWYNLYRLAQKEAVLKGISARAQHMWPEKSDIPLIEKQILQLRDVAYHAFVKSNKSFAESGTRAERAGITKAQLSNAHESAKKSKFANPTRATLEIYLQKPVSRTQSIARLKEELQTANRRETELLWDSIVHLRKPTKPKITVHGPRK